MDVGFGSSKVVLGVLQVLCIGAPEAARGK